MNEFLSQHSCSTEALKAIGMKTAAAVTIVAEAVGTEPAVAIEARHHHPHFI